MCKKSCLLVSFVLLLSMAAISSAADIVWSNGGSDGDWNNGANWTGGVKPNTTSDYARIRITTGPVFTSQSATAFRIYLEGTNGTLTMNGGSLTTNSHIYVAVVSTDTATLNMSGGTITVTTTLYIARDSGSSGAVNLSGGTITCNALNLNTNDQTNGLGRINITSTGTLIINGDVTATIAPWITKGWIKAYNGTGTVNVSTTTNPGKTTVTASAPAKAGNPSPANNATNVSTLADLSWTGIAEANSHNVYFGTVSPGAFQTNTAALTFDPGIMAPSTTYYWRIDEVNGPNTVTGDVWSFTTGSNIATNPNPANGAVNVSVTGTLSWTAGVTAASHNVYFGTNNPPAFIGNQGGTTYNPGTLAFSTTYYWRIDEVRDSNVYTGTVWSFTTEGSIRKGPYLIYPGNNTQMTVLWQMPSTQGCTLAWGTDTSYSTGSIGTTEYGTDHQHKYTITGLTPGTKYYYRVTAGSSIATGSFRSAPAADANSVKFLAYGDTRTYPADHAKVMAQINSTVAVDPAYQTLLLHSGDWVEFDQESSWDTEYFSRSYTATLQMQASMPIMGCMGNHEISGTGPTVFDKYWPYSDAGAGRYYSFDYGPVHIAVLDQFDTGADGIISTTQLAWLANDLSTTTKKWKFILLHEPGWSASGGHPNNADVQTNIQPLCERYGVQIVFCGHNHYYARAIVNGVQHITTGYGGAPYYTPVPGQPNVLLTVANVLEFCQIGIDANSLSYQAVGSDGNVIDSFYIDIGQPDLTFVQVTDVQLGMCDGADSRWQTAVSRINMVNPAFVIDTGDHVQNWSVGSPFTSYINSYLSIAAGIKPGIPLYHAPGNHDIGDAPDPSRYPSFLSVFPNPFPASSSSSVPWYSFSYGNTLFIVLDTLVLKNPSSYVGEDTVEINWLTNTLQNSSGYAHKIVFTHVPICKTSVTEADDSGGFNMPSTPGNGRAYSNIRATLLSLFHQYGVEAVFCGHAHVPYYVNDKGLELVTTESTTCPLGGLSTDTCGIQIVNIYPDLVHVYRCLNCFVSLPCDFNGDGICDGKDLAIFVDHWLDNGIWP